MDGGNANLDCALRLASAGLSVFPCKPTDRHPVFIGWHKRSTAEAATIRTWWAHYPRAVPALNLAACGLVVLDGDRHGSTDGVAALRDLLRQQSGLALRDVPMVHTPRAGVHCY